MAKFDHLLLKINASFKAKITWFTYFVFPIIHSSISCVIDVF